MLGAWRICETWWSRRRACSIYLSSRARSQSLLTTPTANATNCASSSGKQCQHTRVSATLLRLVASLAVRRQDGQTPQKPAEAHDGQEGSQRRRQTSSCGLISRSTPVQHRCLHGETSLVDACTSMGVGAQVWVTNSLIEVELQDCSDWIAAHTQVSAVPPLSRALSGELGASGTAKLAGTAAAELTGSLSPPTPALCACGATYSSSSCNT